MFCDLDNDEQRGVGVGGGGGRQNNGLIGSSGGFHTSCPFRLNVAPPRRSERERMPCMEGCTCRPPLHSLVNTTQKKKYGYAGGDGSGGGSLDPAVVGSNDMSLVQTSVIDEQTA